MATEAGVAQISAAQLLARFRKGETPGQQFVLVDLRGRDFKGGTIRHSLNIPMESLPSAVPTLYGLTLSSGIRDIIFFCGSSCGRGPKGATLLSEYAHAQNVSSDSKGDQLKPQGLVLTSGINGWVEGGNDYTHWMDGFDPEHWSCRSN